MSSNVAVLTLFEHGMNAVKANDYQNAIDLFAAVLRRNEQLTTAQHAKAWLWLAHCLRDADEQRYCIQMALEIDPISCDGAPYTAGASRRPRVFLVETPIEQMLIPRSAPPLPPAAPKQTTTNPQTEADAISRELASSPDLLGRWLGYGARLVEEARARKRQV